MKRINRSIAAVTLASTLVLLLAYLLVASARTVDDKEDAPRLSDWSAPVNLGPPVSAVLTGSPARGGELNPFISRDGLSLYFSSDRPGGFGGLDIWVSQRPSVNDPWGEPQNLGPNVNTPSTENSPALSPDGRRLYFQSDRPGAFGDLDLYVSKRVHKRDDLAWQAATNLGGNVNTSFNESGASLFEDETGTTTLFFSSDRPGGPGGGDVYASTLNDDDEEETFEPAVLVPELSTPEADGSPIFRRDGLEVFQSANRAGSIGGSDLWVRTRASTSDPWSAPVNLGPVVNSPFQENRPALSREGTELYFASNRPSPGGFDIYVSTRTKLKEMTTQE
jgi:Tol biopolymer transport system component